VGVEREGIVYEVFLTTLPQGAFTAADVVALYLHRGSFENALADEDMEAANPTVGAATPPGDRSAGRSSASGSGTCVWN